MDKIDYKGTLLDQFEGLKGTPMFQRMARTVEGSPWHREANVLVHTGMVVDEYIRMTDEACAVEKREWNRTDYLGGMACVFHDTGKPSAETAKYSEARGNYRSYGGHELLSAHKWESYASERGSWFSAREVVMVCFLIEHHMPWSIKEKNKLSLIARTAIGYSADTFKRALLADQSGRLSDAKEKNYGECVDWMNDFMNIVEQERQEELKRVMDIEEKPMFYMPIAPSGAGKSTFLNKLKQQEPELVVFSLDALRHEFYDATDYQKAYEGSVNDKSFESRANARFHQLIKLGKPMYIDNTNLSAKRRRFYVDTARKYNFSPIAVLMPCPLKTLLERQQTRGDKCVPDSAVKQQYKSLQHPLKGEFDGVVVLDHNMKPHP